MNFKFFIFFLLSLSSLPSISKAQDISGDWEISKVVEVSTSQDKLLYEKGNSEIPVQFPDTWITFHNDGTYTATDTHTSHGEANGTWSLTNNSILIDDKSLELEIINDNEFYTIQNKDFWTPNNGIYHGIIRTYYTKVQPLSLLPYNLNADKKKQSILLKWKVNLKDNQKIKIIQHSKDGTNFINIHTIENLSEGEFIHQNPVNGINYYRIKTDNGFSKTISVDFQNSNDDKVKIYPNPTNGIFNIKSTKTIQKIEIQDLTGKTITTLKKPNYSIFDLKNGLYFLKITISDKIYREKILKI